MQLSLRCPVEEERKKRGAGPITWTVQSRATCIASLGSNIINCNCQSLHTFPQSRLPPLLLTLATCVQAEATHKHTQTEMRLAGESQETYLLDTEMRLAGERRARHRAGLTGQCGGAGNGSCVDTLLPTHTQAAGLWPRLGGAHCNHIHESSLVGSFIMMWFFPQ